MTNSIMDKQWIDISHLKLVDDRVLIKPFENPSVTKGGIVVPDEWKRRSTQGTVLKTGEGRVFAKTGVRIPCTCQSGDIVLYSRYGGIVIKLNGENYIIVKESSEYGILAILTQKDTEIDTTDVLLRSIQE